MGCCFSTPEEKEPLLGDQADGKKTKSSKLDFVKLEVQEFDKAFGDFERALDPFVTNREKLEQGVSKFKTAVESLQSVHPQATFREYVHALKTTLKEEGILIKIKNGAVEIYGTAARSLKAVEDAVAAIKSIIAACQSLEGMPEVVTTASASSIDDVEATITNIEHIIRREFPEVFDICKVVRFKKNLKKNLEKMRTTPTMVEDFCEEVENIVTEINEAFDEKAEDDGESETTASEKVDRSEKSKEKSKNDKEKRNGKGKKAKKEQTEKEKNEKEKNEKDEKDKEEKDKEEKDKEEKDSKDGKSESKKDKKPDYHKQLKMEKVGLVDIDRIFTDIMTSLNRFISSREKIQQARESFEKIMKTICNFDGEKEIKEYVKELKKKAMDGKIHIYVDTTDGDIKLDSIQGVDPPAPYRNAVKALNDVKTAAKDSIDLEPGVLKDLGACAEDIAEIEPAKDFKKMVSGMKEMMAIPKKIKAFNENRKKVQQAPEIVKEFGLYVKQIVVDIFNVLTEEEDQEKADEKGNEEDKEEEENKKEVEAMVHTPRKTQRIEDDNQIAVA